MPFLGKKLFRNIKRLGHKAAGFARTGLKYGGMLAKYGGALTANPALASMGLAAQQIGSIEK